MTLLKTLEVIRFIFFRHSLTLQLSDFDMANLDLNLSSLVGLDSLSIEFAEQVTTFTSAFVTPANLRELKLRYNENLKSFQEIFVKSLHSLTALKVSFRFFISFHKDDHYGFLFFFLI
jgi:hypothetical protein